MEISFILKKYISFLGHSYFRTKEVFKMFIFFCKIAQFPQKMNEKKSGPASYICAATAEAHGTAEVDVCRRF